MALSSTLYRLPSVNAVFEGHAVTTIHYVDAVTYGTEYPLPQSKRHVASHRLESAPGTDHPE